jgi:hypothetical protein
MWNGKEAARATPFTQAMSFFLRRNLWRASWPEVSADGDVRLGADAVRHRRVDAHLVVSLTLCPSIPPRPSKAGKSSASVESFQARRHLTLHLDKSNHVFA